MMRTLAPIENVVCHSIRGGVISGSRGEPLFDVVRP